MIELVEPFYYRILNILNYLYKNNNTISFKKCACLNNTSTITAKRDLKYINENFEDYLQSHFDGDVLTVNNSSIGVYRVLSHRIYQQSISMSLFSEIILNPYESRDYFCNKMNISHATFYRLVSLLNENLTRFNIKIKSNHGDFFLYSDDELQIRNYITLFLLEIHGKKSSVLNIRLSVIESLTSSLLSEHIIEDSIQSPFQSFFLLTSFMREVQGFHYTVSDSLISVIEKEQYRSWDYEAIKLVFPQLSETSYKHVYYSFLMIHIPWKSDLEKSYYLDLIHSLSEELIIAMNCEKDHDDVYTIIKHAMAYTMHFPHKPTLFVDRNEYFIDAFIKEHPYWTNRFMNVINKYENRVLVEIQHLATYLLFAYVMNCPDVYMNFANVKLKVKSDLGKPHEAFIKSVLSKHFNDIDFVASNPDILIVTNKLCEEASDEDFVLAINDYPTQEDLVMIKEYIDSFMIYKEV